MNKKEVMIIFDGTNYHEWDESLKYCLKKNNVYKCVTEKKPVDPEVTTVKKEEESSDYKSKLRRQRQKKPSSSDDVEEETSYHSADDEIKSDQERKRYYKLLDKWEEMDEKAQGIIGESVNPRLSYLFKTTLKRNTSQKGKYRNRKSL
jgi:hypothetical protein